MVKITVKVDGMMCSMCENLLNDAVRRAFPVKKVTSSRSKGETVILTQQDIDDERLRQVIGARGYTVRNIIRGHVEESKGLLGFFRK